MIRTGATASKTHPRRTRWVRLGRDILLLPPALLYVIVEHIFWAGAKRLLREASAIGPIAAVQRRLERLPPAAVLPMFLVPEIVSHAGGFWASALLLQRRWASALLVGLLLKGSATLVEVWIYQSCERTLLSVRWFAWLHGLMLRARDWVDDRTVPLRQLARRLLSGGGRGVSHRFAALRSLLARRLGMSRK